MLNLSKSLIAGATVLALAGGSLVYAQQGPDRGRDHGPRGANFTAEDIVAFGDARVAALKAGLKLTAEQEKNWPALEKALKDTAKQRSERFAARASADRPRDPIERLKTRAERMSEAGASLKTIADAAAPLYASLDEGQKQRFVMLSHFEGRRFARFEHDHHGGPGKHGRHGGPGMEQDAPDAPRPR
jgi:zinc resistance-associated protein